MLTRKIRRRRSDRGRRAKGSLFIGGITQTLSAVPAYLWNFSKAQLKSVPEDAGPHDAVSAAFLHYHQNRRRSIPLTSDAALSSMFPSTRLFLGASLALATTVSAAETRFQPEKFFAGHTRSTGVFRNAVGKPEERFATDCQGKIARQHAAARSALPLRVIYEPDLNFKKAKPKRQMSNSRSSEQQL